MAIIIALANHKGGSGKTTVTVQTAAALARAGQRVLVVDLDPQANATEGLGLLEDESNPRPGLVEAWDRHRNPSLSALPVVQPCGWATEQPDGSQVPTDEARLIDVIPARFDLENEEIRWQDADAKHRLALSLDGWVHDNYDVVLIDTRPSLGLLVAEAFIAADAVLIVTEPGRRSLYGAKRVYNFVTETARRANRRLHVAGVVVTRVDSRTSAANAGIEDVRTVFGDLVWDLRTVMKIAEYEHELTPSCIPLSSRIQDADDAQLSLSAYGNDRSTKRVRAVFDQIATRIVSLIPATTITPALAA